MYIWYAETNTVEQYQIKMPLAYTCILCASNPLYLLIVTHSTVFCFVCMSFVNTNYNIFFAFCLLGNQRLIENDIIVVL